jgi:hypothetical protein
VCWLHAAAVLRLLVAGGGVARVA